MIMIMTLYRADVFYTVMLCMFVLCCGVHIKKPTFLKPDGISCTLGERDILFIFFLLFNWDSLHARLNSHYEAWSYKKRSTKKKKNITGHRKSV